MYYKISNPFCIALYGFIIFSTFKPLHSQAQDTGYTRPPVTDNWQAYLAEVKADSSKLMVELKTCIPGIRYDLRYATVNNFMNRLMYPANTRTTYLRLPAANQLLLVQKELKEQGLGLKIFDAYRPFSVTVKFWELIKDERYVANPSKGSGHNRGIAVDLTIINLTTGRELDMGTGFDNFTDSAHQDYQLLPENVLKNRRLLRALMEKHGFVAIMTEWWHFYLSEGTKYEILDIPFSKFLSNK